MATSTSSISGLASGLDTAGIIDQLMQLEAVPQARLQSQQSAEKTVLSALQALNTDTALLGSKAASLADPKTWATLKGTSSGSGISVTVGDKASPQAFDVTVDSLAAAHQFALTDTFALDDTAGPVVAGGSATQVRISRPDGSFTDVDTGTGTLQDVVDGINAATEDTKVSAAAVRVADGSYRLLLRSTETGADSEFSVTNTDGSALAGGVDSTTLKQGADAVIHVGGIQATSSTNTFSDVVSGVTLTLGSGAKAGDTSTVSVAQDPSSVKNTVRALVDQVNALLDTVDTKTASGSATTKAGPLAGDSTARSLRNALADTVFGAGTTSMAAYGIQTDRYGKLVFDEDAFTEAFADDPAATMAQFTKAEDGGTGGWAARVETVAKAASDSTDGTITSAIAGRNATIDRLADSIEDWDGRLELRRETLTRQYTALETALSTLQSQGSWLSSQIASLPSWDS